MRRLLVVMVALLLGATPCVAQVPGSGPGPLVKYGKWLLAAGALGMNYLAAQAHDHAEENFNALERRCDDDHTLCNLDIEGRYSDDQSEALYQESLRYDRRARRWLFGGETALVGAAALFVWELTRHAPKPDNIPFEPEVRSLRQATGVGVRVAF